MRRPHDVGGLEAGPLDVEEHELAPWEKRVRVLQRSLSRRKPPVMSLDELRRGIEDLGEQEYNRLGYYDCWIASITNNMLQKGVISVDELSEKMREVEARWTKARVS